MKVSIITVCYNSEKTIRDTLQSVAKQSYENIEHIVVDGLSKDQTCDIIQEFPHVSKWVSEKDDGLYSAMNKGLQMTTGDIVGILNSDDVFQDETVIENVVRKMQAEEAEALYGDLTYVDEYDLNKVVRYWKANEYKREKWLYGWMPPHPTFYVKKEFYEEFGFFRTDMRSAADYEIMLRFLYKNNIKVCYLPEVIVKMRMGGVSNSSLKNRIRANVQDRRAWQVNGLKSYPFTTLLKPIRKINQFIKK